MRYRSKIAGLRADWQLFCHHIDVVGLRGVRALRQFRHFLKWRSSKRNRGDTLTPQIPWVVYDSIAALAYQVRPGMKIFEFGTGGSTAFFSRRAGHVNSVEHDPEWFERVRSFMNKERLSWDGSLEPPQEADMHDTKPEYYSSDDSYLGLSFQSYVESISVYPDNYFDIILLDGRARNGCYASSIKKLKEGGIFILDNAEREEYSSIEAHAREVGFKIIEFIGPGPYNEYFWRTIHIVKCRP